MKLANIHSANLVKLCLHLSQLESYPLLVTNFKKEKGKLIDLCCNEKSRTGHASVTQRIMLFHVVIRWH